MDWMNIIIEIATGAGKTVFMIVAVLLPLMVGLELAKDAKILDRAARFIRPIMRLFTLPKEGAYPMLAGVFFGISYGSGIILGVAREGALNARDLTLIGLFLAVCHGMIEDPLIFVTIGANWWVVVGTRVVMGLVVMLLVSRLWRAAEIEPPETAGEEV